MIDEICPDYVGDDRITVTLDPDSTPRAFSPFTVRINYSRCDPEGVVLPLEICLVAPSGANSECTTIRTVVPDIRIFMPREGGAHLVVVRELYHNQWWGRLRVQVAGERLREASKL
jgi:hypothetical protein